MNQEERDAEAKRNAARGGRRSQVVEGAAVGAVAVEAPAVENAASAASRPSAVISQMERDAEAKNRARGARRAQAVGAITTPGVVSEPVDVSEPAAVPGVRSVSGDEARTLEERMQRKEERGAARANRRNQATTTDGRSVPEPAPEVAPGAVVVTASAAMQQAPKVDSVVSTVSAGAVNVTAPADVSEPKKLEENVEVPENPVLDDRQRRVNEKLAEMEREEEIRDRRNAERLAHRQEKQPMELQENTSPNRSAGDDNPTGHFAPHLLRPNLPQAEDKADSIVVIRDKSESIVQDKSELVDKSEPFSPASSGQEQAVTTIVDHGAITAPDVIGGYFQPMTAVDDDQLAVAIAIDDDEEEKIFVTGVEYDPDSKPPLYKNRRFRMYGLCGCMCIVLAIIFVVVILAMGGGDKVTFRSLTLAPTYAPTGAPTTARENIFLAFFASEVGDQVYEAGTPHSLAARWIMFDDPKNLAPDAENLLQRYLLAFLYFHTTRNGQDVWRSCNPPGIQGSDGNGNVYDDIIEGEPDKCILYEFVRLPNDDIAYEPLYDRVRWMSNTDECEWEGVKCQGGTEVLGVEFFGQRLQGTLPTEIGALPFLQSISFPYNDFSGTIPSEYGSLRHLLNLEVHGNLLSGQIPEEFFDQTGNSLVAFNVGDNLISGTLSTGIGYLRDLKGLHVFDNNLRGAFPTEIGRLGFLSYTRISGNEFSGPIPTQLGRLFQLSEFWFQDNQWTGTIPSELGQLTRLLDFRLSGNPELGGTIPTELYQMVRLKRFDLQSQKLTGTLSPLIANITDLEQLRVSRNQLTGTIPVELAALSGLRLAWLHLNNMIGSMPLEVCNNVGTNKLEYLQTDCSPEDAPPVSCLCCSACCNRETEVCLTKT